MLISASVLRPKLVYSMEQAIGSRGMSVPKWRSDEIYIFCDVCGANMSIQRVDETSDSETTHIEWPPPDGWLTIHEAHLCTDCVLELDALDMPQMDYCIDDIPDEAVLNAETASALSASEDGVLEIPEGIRSIGYKAFMYRDDFSRVILPSTLEHIGQYAFSYSTLTSLEAPAALKAIDDKAFFQCDKLAQVHLNEGILSLGFETFAHSGLQAIHVPKSLMRLERNTFEKTNLVLEGPDATLTIDADNPHYALDDDGGLYLATPQGLILLTLLSFKTTNHTVRPGTYAIHAGAYARNTRVESITLPEGLVYIESEAFHGCAGLKHIELPSTLHTIGSSAFVGTNIREFDLPASLVSIGPYAFDIGDGEPHPSICKVHVHPDNPRLFTYDHALCARQASGGCCVIHSFANKDSISLPEGVVSIGPHALTDVSGNRHLSFGNTMHSVHPYAFPYKSRISCSIKFNEPLEGRDYVRVFDVRRQIIVSSTLGGKQLNVELLIWINDLQEALTHNPYELACYALDRFEYPQFLKDIAREKLVDRLEHYAEDIILACAERNDYLRIELMAKWGLLTPENITGIIDRVSATENAAATACLFEIKKQRFGMSRMDFSL